ncbi:MAG: Lin0512 family protein [Planctomycetaceae bacterium]|nr:Lin0512 family protein [Planctomycetaceae bacterium]
MKRYIIEFGIGMDFHGQDVNKAAQKAVRDAVSKSCLCGLTEVLNLDNLDERVHIHATVAVTRPEDVNPAALAACLPLGKVTVNAVSGGLRVPGLYLARFGDKDDSIEVAVAALEVGIESAEE